MTATEVGSTAALGSSDPLPCCPCQAQPIDGSVFASPIVDLLQNASRRRTYAHSMLKHRRTPKWVDVSLRCSFCGKRKEQVGKLIAGPGICICDECVGQCNDIIEKDRTPSR